MSKLIFELSSVGRRCSELPPLDVELVQIDEALTRQSAPSIPEVAEVDLVRHYMELSRQAFGVDNGFYPLGSCTMKYNPKINEETSSLAGFAHIHPLQPESTVNGALQSMDELSSALCEVTGMDAFTLQPSAASPPLPAPRVPQAARACAAGTP